jgi:segregation and condensation protein A
VVGPNDEQEQPQAALPNVDTDPQGEPRAAPVEAEDDADDGAYRVKLNVFEGPLDLLLHLIRKHELDILDIPISFITEKYLAYLEMMDDLSIDVASEYLVMAATLAYIKSRTLLPPDPSAAGDEDGDLEELDPRADLVKRLLEYQKYKHAAEQLGGRHRMGRDVFVRGNDEPVSPEPAQLAPFSVFKLFDAFERVLKRANQVADHQVLFERISIADRVIQLTEVLFDKRRANFEDLFGLNENGGAPQRLDMVITFLAILEMCKMRVIRVLQEDALGSIVVEFAPKRIDGDAEPAPPADEQEKEEQDDGSRVS